MMCLLCIVAIFLPASRPQAAPNSLPAANSLIERGAYLVSRNGSVVLAQNEGQLLVPASTWKIATALMAFDCLGEGYRFESHFFLQDGDLYIKGYGDPFLVSEEAEEIVRVLRQRGVLRLHDIVLDGSFFQLEQVRAPGAENSLAPYDAANSGLAVNFNAINVEVAEDGTLRSAELQTPLLPVMRTVAAALPPGAHRVNLSQQSARIDSYVGELFQAFLSRQGVVCLGSVRKGKVPESAKPVYRHRSSRSLVEVVGKMMHYSNNFIANQLFLACGAKVYTAPATWRKGEQALSAFLLASGIGKGEFQVKEGSGLSRENRITATALLHLLKDFVPYANLLPKTPGRLLKSGTLNGVYAYAGYFVNGVGLDPLVLILNQPKNSRAQVIDRLERHYRSL